MGLDSPFKIEQFIDHYARLAMMPGWIDHARYQVGIMEKDPTGLFTGLGKAIAARIKELENESSTSGSESR